MSEKLNEVAVFATAPECAERAQQLSEQLDLKLLSEFDRRFCPNIAVLLVSPEGLELQETGKKAPGPIKADFVTGAVAHRRKFGGGSGQLIAKAVGMKSGVRPRVLDATAGLGRDAFVLATLGCEVEMIERQPIVHTLLNDGLERAQDEPEIDDIMARMQLHHGQSQALMRNWPADKARPQVIYLDPMFPHSDKSAQVKKEMAVFRTLVGDDLDTSELLAAALELAENRVVVKRPRKAPCIEGPEPTLALEGKSSRYDIYAFKALEPNKA